MSVHVTVKLAGFLFRYNAIFSRFIVLSEHLDVICSVANWKDIPPEGNLTVRFFPRISLLRPPEFQAADRSPMQRALLPAGDPYPLASFSNNAVISPSNVDSRASKSGGIPASRMASLVIGPMLPASGRLASGDNCRAVWLT